MELTNYNEEEKISLVEEFKEREISINEYAREKGIPSTTFRDWLKKDREIGFGKINVKQAITTTNTKIVKKAPTIFATENIRIELKEGFDKEFLKQIVGVLIHDK